MVASLRVDFWLQWFFNWQRHTCLHFRPVKRVWHLIYMYLYYWMYWSKECSLYCEISHRFATVTCKCIPRSHSMSSWDTFSTVIQQWWNWQLILFRPEWPIYNDKPSDCDTASLLQCHRLIHNALYVIQKCTITSCCQPGQIVAQFV